MNKWVNALHVLLAHHPAREILLYHSNTTDNMLVRAKLTVDSELIFGAAEVVRNDSATFRSPTGEPMRLSPRLGRAIQLST